MQSGEVFNSIYEVVKKIPKGKVGTYGQIAKQTENLTLKTQKRRIKVSPRIVGFALHANPDPKNIPCHRVVKKDGSLAKGYAYGGIKAQKKRLMEEGVEFVGKCKVDLDLCLWRQQPLKVAPCKVY
jgi:methylated-DNA-protein-cysteine methyltransferase-like protein